MDRVKHDLPLANTFDPVIEAYKKDVDRTLLRENLKLTVEQRFQKFHDYMRFLDGVKSAGQIARKR